MKRALHVFPILVILAVFLRNSTGDFQIRTRDLLLFYLIFGIIGFAWHTYRNDDLEISAALALFVSYLAVGVILMMFLLLQKQGIQDPARGTKLALFLLLFLVFVGVSMNYLSYLKSTGVYLLAFGLLYAIFLSHASKLRPGSGLATFPLLAGMMMGLNLFITPRYLSRKAFLWFLSGLSAWTVLVGLVAYISGQYSMLSMEIGLRNTFVTVPLLGTKLNVLESVFANPNTLGILTFSGTFAAIVLTWSVYKAQRAPGLWIIPSIVVLINGIGLFLSYSRAGYLALAVAVGLYAAGELFGRAALPYAFIVLSGTVGLFLLLIGGGLFGVNPAGRFTLWAAGVQALLDSPSLFGLGIIDPSQPIAPYIEGPLSGQSPHNSYISIFLRAGLLGGSAYLVLTLGSLLHGVFLKDNVDIAMLSFAFGFVLHQFFEAYTMYQYSLAAVLSSIVIGYLLLDGIPLRDPSDASVSDAPKKTFGGP